MSCSVTASPEPEEGVSEPQLDEDPNPSGSQSFSFSNLPPVAELGESQSKKMEMIQSLHELNETCVRAAEFLADKELPLPSQADYLISALRTTTSVLNSFYRKCMSHGLGTLVDHDYDGLPAHVEGAPTHQVYQVLHK